MSALTTSSGIQKKGFLLSPDVGTILNMTPQVVSSSYNHDPIVISEDTSFSMILQESVPVPLVLEQTLNPFLRLWVTIQSVTDSLSQ